MKVKYRPKDRAKPLLIAGCFHIGAKTADLAMAHAYVEFVRKEDGFCLLLADNHECAVPRKASMMFEQNLTPQEQLDESVKLFDPIKRNIKGCVTGNHAWRAYRDAGIELDKEMMSRLGIPHHYYGFQGVVDIPFGSQTYKVVFVHGNNTGKNVFGNCEKMEVSYPGADIYAASHSHVLSVRPKSIHVWRGAKVELRDYYHVVTGSLLNYPLYASQALYQPQPKGFAVAWLYPNEHRIDVDVNGHIPGYNAHKCPTMAPYIPKVVYPHKEVKSPPCPKCGGLERIKNGRGVRNGKITQRMDCAGCMRKRLKDYRAKQGNKTHQFK